MNFSRSIIIAVFLLIFSGVCFSQTNPPNKIILSKNDVKAVKASAAYTEVLLKRTELEADLEDLLVAYTLEYPKVMEIQFQLGLIKTEMDKLFATKSSETQKLTLALGKLIVRKIELETELWNLKKQYSDEHPEVKKAKRKILVFESAIKDVLL